MHKNNYFFVSYEHRLLLRSDGLGPQHFFATERVVC